MIYYRYTSVVSYLVSYQAIEIFPTLQRAISVLISTPSSRIIFVWVIMMIEGIATTGVMPMSLMMLL